MENLVPIESKEGVTIYGKVIDGKGKLGQFQVYSDFGRSEIYSLYADAEKKMDHMIGVKNN